MYLWGCIMIKSAEFVIEKIIIPTKQLYEKARYLKDGVLKDGYKEQIVNIRNQSAAAEVVLKRLKKTGDVHNFLKKSISSSTGETKRIMNDLNLLSFEDIIEEFENKFKTELSEFTTTDELIINEVYTTWDFVFLAKIYRTQTTGILGLYDEENKPNAVIARGNFSDDETGYNNSFIKSDKTIVKYYLIRGNHKFNRYITENKLDVYLFQTIGSNQQQFLGVYELESYDPLGDFVILKSKKEQNKKHEISTITETPYEYRRKFTVTEKIAPGHSRAGEYKAGSGSKAEQIVSNYLNSKNIDNERTSMSEESHFYDINVNGLISLEIKNITNNKSFYLSNTQIKLIQEEKTRLCFVNSKYNIDLIYISKPYKETKELKNIFAEYSELKKYSIEKYNGRLRIDSIEIGIIKPEKNIIDDLYKDFVLINNLSRKELIDFLSNK